MRRRSESTGRWDAAAALEASVGANPDERMIAERRRLTSTPDPNEPDPWGLAPVATETRVSVNRCPDCGEPQFHAPGSGWSCKNGHGFGEPSGPAENAAPTPAKVAGARKRGASVAINAGTRTVTVTIGKQGFAPIRFHTFDVGSVSMTATLAPGDDLQEAARGMLEELEVVFRGEFERTMEAHFALVKRASECVRENGGER